MAAALWWEVAARCSQIDSSSGTGHKWSWPHADERRRSGDRPPVLLWWCRRLRRRRTPAMVVSRRCFHHKWVDPENPVLLTLFNTNHLWIGPMG
jgi:hypothetical protein